MIGGCVLSATDCRALVDAAAAGFTALVTNKLLPVRCKAPRATGRPSDACSTALVTDKSLPVRNAAPRETGAPLRDEMTAASSRPLSRCIVTGSAPPSGDRGRRAWTAAALPPGTRAMVVERMCRAILCTPKVSLPARSWRRAAADSTDCRTVRISPPGGTGRETRARSSV